MEGDARQIASAADDSANSRSLLVLWRFSSEVVGATGFEPATPCAQGRCATRLRYAPTRVDLTPNDHRTRIASVVEGPTRRSSSLEITGVICAFCVHRCRARPLM